MIAAIETGGTKINVALARAPEEILFQERISTTMPEETLKQIRIALEKAQKIHGKAQALAIGTFGPVDLSPQSLTYGMITETPKPGWSQTDILSPLRDFFQIPSIIDTDVNAALLGEAQWGEASQLKNAAYLTVGTGIGGGLLMNGKLIHGIGHPELGHMLVTPHPEDSFAGCCPFHGNCLEGMASGLALKKRWGRNADELEIDHPAWELEAEYLAQACYNLMMIVPPTKIIIGGGVMKQQQLYPLIRERFSGLLKGYLSYPEITDHLDSFIVPPHLGEKAALMGCVVMGQRILKRF